jgi:phosphoribosylformylglycinamidine synthase
MGTLVRACEACRDAALAYGIPFISGKDSLHNQFTDQQSGKVIKIPNTLLISAIGVIEDVRKCVTMDLKRAGNSLWRILAWTEQDNDDAARERSLRKCRFAHEHVAALLNSGMFSAVHDVSDGGTLVAVAEMAIASGLGVELRGVVEQTLFDEFQASYIVEVESSKEREFIARGAMVSPQRIGTVIAEPVLKVGDVFECSMTELTSAWRGTLDW